MPKRMSSKQVPPKPRKQVRAPKRRSTFSPNSPATRITGNDSTLTVVGEELAYGVTSQENQNSLDRTNRLNFWPGASGLVRLDQYGKMFDQYHVDSLCVHYLTASGTTVTGSTITAIDYDSSDLPITVQALQVSEPRRRTPVWESSSLTVDPGRLNKSRWMFTAGGTVADTPGYRSACTILSSAPAANPVVEYGEVWVKYKVTFTGPTTSFSNVGFAIDSLGEPGSAPPTWTGDTGGFAGVIKATPSDDATSVTLQPAITGDYIMDVVNNANDAEGVGAFYNALDPLVRAWTEDRLRVIQKSDALKIYRLRLTEGSTMTLPAVLGTAAFAVLIRRVLGDGQSLA